MCSVLLHGQCYLLPAPEYLGLAAEGLPNNKQDAPVVQYPVWLFRSKKESVPTRYVELWQVLLILYEVAVSTQDKRSQNGLAHNATK